MKTKSIPFFRGVMRPRTTVALLAATLLSGCTNIPKSDLRTLQADCPNVLWVSRCDVPGGVAVSVETKRTARISATLESARALKQLARGTNSVTLAGGEGKRLLEVGIERLWPPSFARYYTLERLNLKDWSGVGDLTDEQLSALASRNSSFAQEMVYVPTTLYLPPDFFCPKSSRDHCNYKYFDCPKPWRSPCNSPALSR